MPTLAELCDEYADDFLAFDRIENPLNRRPDICAFLLLDSIVPPSGHDDIVACAEHDQIWLDVDGEKLVAAATPEQIRDLRRCGVFYDEDVDSLSMFV